MLQQDLSSVTPTFMRRLSFGYVIVARCTNMEAALFERRWSNLDVNILIYPSISVLPLLLND